LSLLTNQKPIVAVPTFLKAAYLDQSPIVCIKAGRRTGKTYNFVTWLLQEMDSNPGQPALWVDTAQGNIQKYVDRYFEPELKKMNHWENCHWDKQRKVMHLYNGAYIDFGSAERPELMEGFGYARGVLNEAGLIFKKANLWDNTLYPMLKEARVRIIGTPKGNNKFKELYHSNPHYSFSCYDSPFWTPQEIEAAQRAMTQEAFKQEMLAEFIEGAGAVFRNINILVRGSLLTEPRDGRYVLAADLAKHQDFTVILIGDLNTNQVVYYERFNQIDWGLQKSRIIAAYNKFKCVKGIVDATGVGDSIFDDLISAGLDVEGFKFTSASKQELVSNLSVAMDNMSIHYPHIETLLDELSIFAYEQRANGSFSYSAPDGYHDDTVMALGLLNRLFNVKPVEWAGVR